MKKKLNQHDVYDMLAFVVNPDRVEKHYFLNKFILDLRIHNSKFT